MNNMMDPVPTNVRMLLVAAASNAAPQGGTEAEQPVIANPYLRRWVTASPAPPCQAMIGTSGNIVVHPLKTPTKHKELTRHDGGARKESGWKITNQMHGPFCTAG
eukprot:scaffold79564_cov69-Attheya_sp.AAC.1